MAAGDDTSSAVGRASGRGNDAIEFVWFRENPRRRRPGGGGGVSRVSGCLLEGTLLVSLVFSRVIDKIRYPGPRTRFI